MLDKLAQIENRFEEVKQEILDPEVMKDMKRYKELNIEYKHLEEISKKATEYKETLSNIEASKEILETESDAELREMAKEELAELNPQVPVLEEELKILLIPKDPNDSKNVVLEISAGTGGDEASLFAGDLFRMYQRYCDRKGLRFEVTSISEGSQGGYKEAVATISGADAYGIFKFEAGVHRVQRVPKTESQGRIHTSAATVATMPEVEEMDFKIEEKDIIKEITNASGPGGQSVNTTYSAVKLTHKPTGVRVSMQDEKSQLKNLEKAMKILRARVYQIELDKRKAEEDTLRRSMVGSGDRSEKIRTYNFPQGRVTDHRINLTLYNLSAIMDGDIDEIIQSLRVAENAEKLKEGGM
ncbi:peptide chain release factor 1 [Pontibacter sp. G13]|uniref:peptide chain release factor 1 n=1 Tax=Pontibacter sp. G13 TaxID=3074898 RepID=UPI0028897544|nr:peptide chain release factor 1 [Pontibacter sp. G13]WNJ19426.1 peptide chain release factor 1 [Pontibacter sp. G13]